MPTLLSVREEREEEDKLGRIGLEIERDREEESTWEEWFTRDRVLEKRGDISEAFERVSLGYFLFLLCFENIPIQITLDESGLQHWENATDNPQIRSLLLAKTQGIFEAIADKENGQCCR